MVSLHLGSIPLGQDALTAPTSRDISRVATYAQHDVTRGKPVLQNIGEELDTQTISFFFSEEFCNPRRELNKLELAYALKTPLPLIATAGGFTGLRYVVDTLDISVQKTNRAGGIVRVEATMTLIEAPITDLLGLFRGIARTAAQGLAGVARNNPNVRR